MWERADFDSSFRCRYKGENYNKISLRFWRLTKSSPAPHKRDKEEKRRVHDDGLYCVCTDRLDGRLGQHVDVPGGGEEVGAESDGHGVACQEKLSDVKGP